MATGSALKLSLGIAITMVALSACTGSTSGATTTPMSMPPMSMPSTTPSGGTDVNELTDVLHGGLYRFGPFGDGASSFTIASKGPDGWTGYPDWAMDGPEPLRADAPNGIGVAYFLANGLFSDPCHWDWKGTGQADVGDVKVGPGVNDMVAALRENTYYTTTAPKQVTIDGYDGKELELQMPDGSYTHCDKDDPSDAGGHQFVFSGSGLYTQGPANHWDVFILDVRGQRLIATVLSYAKTPRSDVETATDAVMTLSVER